MSDKPETLADICARIRTIDESMMRDLDFIAVFLEFLPRDIEAAARLERESLQGTIDKMRRAISQSSPGDVAAMRDALNRVGHLAKDLRNITERDTEVRADVNEIVDVCRAALAAPARNCDVGTAEEQAHRFHAFCSDNTSEIEGMCNSTCPCIDCGDKCHCLCVWSQMPFVPAKGGRE